MKKLLCLLLALGMCLSVFAGCSGNEKEPGNTTREPEPSTQDTPADTGEQQAMLSLKFSEVTLAKAGETATVYEGKLTGIVWKSEDPAVATVENGVVTAVAKGETKVVAEYQGQVQSCKVVCNLPGQQTTPPPASQTQNPSTQTQPQPTGSRAPVKTPPTTQVVDSSFFNDAAFVGDSISLKLRNYAVSSGALGSATFMVRGSYGVGNETVKNPRYYVEYQGRTDRPLEEALKAAGVKKVFIMLGMNDIGLYGVDGTITNWGTLITRLKTALPDVKIYIQSMTPVWTGGEKGGLRNPNVDAYNQKLKAFAQAQGIAFIDVAPYMKDSTGGLATAYCSDKYVHLTDEGAKAWIAVLKAYNGY